MRRAVFVLLVTVLSGVLGITATAVTFLNSERSVSIGAHTARVSPTLDGYATFDFGPLLPAVRVDLEQRAPLGVFIDVRDTSTQDLEEIVLLNAVIASQPAGEIAKIEDTLREMFTDAVWRGVGVSLLSMLIFGGGALLIGVPRWRALDLAASENKKRTAGVAVGVAATLVLSGVLIMEPGAPGRQPTYANEDWIPLTQAFPHVPSDVPNIQRVEVPANAATQAGAAIVDSVIETYRTSQQFYGDLREVALAAEVRTPEEDEVTALVVTDRHNNVGMDPVAEAIAQIAEASYVFNLGDDTSTGGSWEAFSIDSFANTFENYRMVAVAGNHDQGPFVVGAMRDYGVEVLDGEPFDLDDIRLLGESDPRSSGLTAGYDGTEEDSIDAIRDQDARLTETACEDGEIDTVLLHAQSSARALAASNCVRLILTGHLHRQVGPNVVGESTVTLTTASTGGAAFAFALGSKLRRPAQVTIVTYRDGRSVGLQSVDFDPSGDVSVQDYIDLDELIENALDEDAE